MPTITQTANANAIWNGTVPADAAPAGIFGYRLYCSQALGQQIQSYRFVAQFLNPLVGTVPLGPLTYGALGLQTPTRPFSLKVTKVKGSAFNSGQESELMAEPTLTVAVSPFVGWTLAQLLEQDGRPVVLVGLDPITGMFYPLNVITDGGTGFKLKT
jgi:hypothetical protein